MSPALVPTAAQILGALLSGAAKSSAPSEAPSDLPDRAGLALLAATLAQQTRPAAPAAPSAPLRLPWVVPAISFLWIVGFLGTAVAVIVALAAGAKTFGSEALPLLFMAFGLQGAGAIMVLMFFFGSSLGSRWKDGLLRQGEAAEPSVVPIVPDVEPPTTPPDEGGGKVMTIRGRVSHFGGPDDSGVKPDEGVAIIEPNRLDRFPEIKALFLPRQPPGTTGLARRLDPSKNYVACRWDYKVTPKSWLRTIEVEARNPRSGKAVKARPIDWGPGRQTGRAVDVSPAVLSQLGLKTDDQCEVIVPLPEATAPAIDDQPGGPAWLARAVALRGLYEHRGSADNPVILDMARACGGKIADVYVRDEIAWCALFTNYCLIASGHEGTDSLWALDFANYGKRLSGPAVGAIASKRRSGGGHVFLVLGRDHAGRLVGIGGNQSDMVCDDEFDAESIVAYVWPEDVPAPAKVGSSKTDTSVLPLVTPVPKARRNVDLPQ